MDSDKEKILLAKLHKQLEENLKLPIHKRFKLALRNILDDWKLRKFYNPLWLIESIVDAFYFVIGKNRE